MNDVMLRLALWIDGVDWDTVVERAVLALLVLCLVSIVIAAAWDFWLRPAHLLTVVHKERHQSRVLSAMVNGRPSATVIPEGFVLVCRDETGEEWNVDVNQTVFNQIKEGDRVLR